MKENINRRELLKKSSAGLAAVTIYSTPVQAAEQNDNDRIILLDISIINNGKEKKSITIEIYGSKSKDQLVYSRSFPLHGFKGEGGQEDKPHKYVGSIAASGDGGSYHVVASVPGPEGEKLQGSTSIQINKDGIGLYYNLNVRVSDTTGLNVSTGG